MERYVEVKSIHGDRTRLERRIAHAGYSLVPPKGDGQGVALLAHPDLAACRDGHEALKMAQRLKKDLDSVARYASGDPLTFEIGHVLRIQDDGTLHPEAFATLTGIAIVMAQGDLLAGVAVQTVTEEERLRHAKEVDRLKQEAEAQVDARDARLVAAAMRNSVVGEVLAVLNDPQAGPHALWGMYEKVKKAVGGEAQVAALIGVNHAEVSRFWQTICDPRALGDDARHGAPTKPNPPVNPMTRDEAPEFARRIGRAWLDSL